MASEVEETLKRLVSHKGVIGTIVVGVNYLIIHFTMNLCIDIAHCAVHTVH